MYCRCQPLQSHTPAARTNRALHAHRRIAQLFFTLHHTQESEEPHIPQIPQILQMDPSVYIGAICGFLFSIAPSAA